MNINELEELVESYLDLEDGWDGYGAPKVPNTIIHKTLLILNGLDELPDEVFPTPHKTIQLEYNKDEDNSLDIEIDERCIYFLEVKNGIENEWVEYDEDCINQVLKTL